MSMDAARRFVGLVLAGCLASLVWAASAGAAEQVFWTNYYNSTLSFARLDGSGGNQLGAGGATVDGPRGVALDPATGRIYWSNILVGGPLDQDTISYAQLDGSGGGGLLNTAGIQVLQPFGIALDPVARVMYWGSVSGIYYARLDGSGGGQFNTQGSIVDGPLGLAVDPAAGLLYWTNNGDNTIFSARLNGQGGAKEPLNTAGATVSSPEGIALDRAAGRIYWVNANSTIYYARLDGSGGGGQLNTTGATLSNPMGLAVDPAAGRIYWANTTNDTIQYARLDGTGGGAQLNTAGATPADPSFLVLSKIPVGAGVPAVSGGSVTESALSCSTGTWLGDAPESFLWRAPLSLAYQWSLNGTDIAGATGSAHTARTPGDYRCRETALNAAGSESQTSAAFNVSSPSSSSASPSSPTATGDTSSPEISSVAVRPRRWRAGSGRAGFSRRLVPVGTTITFRLSEDSQVTLSFDRVLPGRRVGRRCVAPTRLNRSRPRCTRYRPKGSLVRSLGAGLRRVRFQGRLTRVRRLGLGRHRVRIDARDAAGNRARTRIAYFTIVAR
jgi:hypothetical protein